MNHPEFSIPAVRGTQGGHAFYTAMCPIRLLPKLFPIGTDQAISEVHQSFRHVNKSRVREIANDIIAHHDSFHMAAVTITIEQQIRFQAAESTRPKRLASGELFIPLEARLTIVDGIHRIYGLQRAIKDCPSLADESIAMLIYVDPDGSRRGQIFSDVKRYERSTAQSQRIGLDERDEVAKLTREVIAAVPVFANSIEMEKTAISNRSRKLFTLSALYQANRTLLANLKDVSFEERLSFAIDFWNEVSKRIPGWTELVDTNMSPAEIRAGYIHCHAIGIAAIARAGRALLTQSPDRWKKRLAKLATLDWSRSNTALWEGRAMIGGKLSKSSSAIARAGIVVKKHLGLSLSREEIAIDA